MAAGIAGNVISSWTLPLLGGCSDSSALPHLDSVEVGETDIGSAPDSDSSM
jgi:hypothetical protein